MAYVTQEKKATIAAALKLALAGTGVKFTLAVRHHSTVVCTIKSGPVDFISNYAAVNADNPYRDCILADVARGKLDVNHYHLDHAFDGEALAIMEKIKAALNTGNWDRSDSQSDYFDVGHYVDLNVGSYDRPYVLLASTTGSIAA